MLLTQTTILCNMKKETTKQCRKGDECMKISRDKINIEMARKTMTVAQLADAYGVSRARINVILNQREVSVVSAGRLAAALGVDVTEIIE